MSNTGTRGGVTKTKRRSFWVEEMPDGELRYRTSSKLLFAMLIVLIPAVIYLLLILLEGLTGGPGIITALAYGVIVLVVVAMLMVVVVSLIDYLRRFE